MNSKIAKLIKIVVTNPSRNWRFETLATNLGVSTRMIRNYLTEILSFYGKETIKKYFIIEPASITFLGDRENALMLYKMCFRLDFYQFKLSMKERQDMIRLILLFSDTPITIRAMESFFSVGRGTILRDLNIVQHSFFEDSNISFSANKSKGCSLSIDEWQRRKLLYQNLYAHDVIGLLEQDSFSLNIYSEFAKHILQPEKNYSYFTEAIHLAESQLHISITDIEYYQLLLYLFIACYRISAGHYVNCMQHVSYSPNGLSITFAQYIFHNLKDILFCPENEIQNFAQFIKELQLSSLHSSKESADYMKFYFAVRNFLLTISMDYSVNFLANDKLIKYLIKHLLGMKRHTINQSGEHSSLTWQMKADYPNDFYIVKKHIHILEACDDTHFNDDEIAYILMHIIASLEQLSLDMPMPDIIIACNSGISTANFLSTIIRKNFHVNIVSVSSTHEIKNLLSRIYADAIISTIPLRNVQIPWIQTNIIPSPAELTRIGDFINGLHSKNIHGSMSFPIPSPRKTCDSNTTPNSLWELLPNSHILLDMKACDWQEAILLAGQPLLTDKTITNEYLMAMIANVIENGPYIVFAPGIALAHANPEHGINGLGLSFLRLLSPISFGHPENDPVEFIVAISMFDIASHINILFKLIDILCNPEALLLLHTAKDPVEIRKIFRKYDKSKGKPLEGA